MASKKPRRPNKRVFMYLLAVTAALLVTAFAVIFVMVRHHGTAASGRGNAAVTAASQTPPGKPATHPSADLGNGPHTGGPVPLDERNTRRLGDASQLSASIREFYGDNIVTFPTAYVGGQLTASGKHSVGAPLAFYTGVQFAAAPHRAVTSDVLVFVPRAACSPDGSAVTSSVDSDFAVQLGKEQSDGSFHPICQEL